MVLESIRISRQKNWSDKTFFYTGEVELLGENSSVSLRVSDELCRKIIALCADNVVEVAQETAQLMKADIINSVAQITG